jgi:hypothetical protein
MTSSKEEILKILQGLMKIEDIYACMLVSKGMSGIIPDRKLFKKEILPIWEMLSMTMDETFSLIDEYEKYGLTEINFSLLDYEVIFFIIPNTNTSLVVIRPKVANKGLIRMELDKTRRDIIRVLK